MDQWYTLYTKPNSEHRVVAALCQPEIETYLPIINNPANNHLQQQIVLFPCYLFMKADLTRISYSYLQWTPGLRRIIAFDNQPASVPDAFIDLLRKKVAEASQVAHRTKHQFEVGEPVQIIEGPFTGLTAIFDGPMTVNERVAVLLEILGSVHRLEINCDSVARVTPNQQAPRPSTVKPKSTPPRRTRGRGRLIKKQSSQPPSFYQAL